jgi:hypothetical protein
MTVVGERLVRVVKCLIHYHGTADIQAISTHREQEGHSPRITVTGSDVDIVQIQE